MGHASENKKGLKKQNQKQKDYLFKRFFYSVKQSYHHRAIQESSGVDPSGGAVSGSPTQSE